MRVNAYPGFVTVLNCTDQTLTDVSIIHSCGFQPVAAFTVTSLAPGDCATKSFTSEENAVDVWAISLKSASGRQYTGRLKWEYTRCDSPQGVILQLTLDQWFVINPVAARGDGSWVPTGPLESVRPSGEGGVRRKGRPKQPLLTHAPAVNGFVN